MDAMQSEIHKCGEKLVIDLPDELSSKLGWGVGDILNIEVAGDGLKIERAMTADEHGMKIARECMDEYRETFEALAKT
jgi:bifunctional DNA-binding transcriptional regulator/antitoxin component of YhaV-PrlF toxin-antitoxin module